jgi:hypothetical protein
MFALRVCFGLVESLLVDIVTAAAVPMGWRERKL